MQWISWIVRKEKQEIEEKLRVGEQQKIYKQFEQYKQKEQNEKSIICYYNSDIYYNQRQQMYEGKERIELQNGKSIRSITLLEDGGKAAIMAMLEVLIIDLQSATTLTNIRRLSAPKAVVGVEGKSYFIVHFCDNYCIVYDSNRFQAIYIIIGLFSDHNGIKTSTNGYHLLYGNNTAIQMWNMAGCQIQMLTHQFKFISSYAINSNGSEIYLGNYYGEVHLVKAISLKQLKYSKAPIGQLVKVHQQCIMGLECIDDETVATIDFLLEIAIIKSVVNERKIDIICKINMNGQINKQISFMYNREKASLCLSVNEGRWAIGLNGKIQSLLTNGKETLLVCLGKQKVFLAVLPNKNEFILNTI